MLPAPNAALIAGKKGQSPVTEIKIIPAYSEVKPSDFYVYIHRRATDGTAFYVGKGNGRRAWDVRSRNKQWMHIAKKHGVCVSLLSQGMTEVCAYTLERIAIRYIGISNLANQTFGGEGVDSGPLRDKSPRYNHQEYEIWHDVLGYFKGTQWDIRNKFGINHSKLSDVCGGKRISVNGWVLLSNKGKPKGDECHSGHLHTSYDPTIYHFVHKDGRSISATKMQFREITGCHSSNVFNLVSGRYKTCMGWKIDNGLSFDDEMKYHRKPKIQVRIWSGEIEACGPITYVCKILGLNRNSVETTLRRGSKKYKEWSMEVLNEGY